MHAIAIECRNVNITMVWSAECSPMEKSMENEIGERSGWMFATRNKVWRWYYWKEIRAVVLCASSRQNVNMNGLIFRWVSHRSSARTVTLLDSPKGSSYQEWRTSLRRFCARAARLCPLCRPSWAMLGRLDCNTAPCVQRPVSSIS